MMYLVGVDGSDTATAAAGRAGALARAEGGTVHVVCAYTDERHSGPVSSVIPPKSAAPAAERVVEDQVALYESLGVAATSTIGEGTPAKVLLAEAERIGADVIVVGNKRMQGLGRLLGSVASEVAHHAPCDVLIVKTT